MHRSSRSLSLDRESLKVGECFQSVYLADLFGSVELGLQRQDGRCWEVAMGTHDCLADDGIVALGIIPSMNEQYLNFYRSDDSDFAIHWTYHVVLWDTRSGLIHDPWTARKVTPFVEYFEHFDNKFLEATLRVGESYWSFSRDKRSFWPIGSGFDQESWERRVRLLPSSLRSGNARSASRALRAV